MFKNKKLRISSRRFASIILSAMLILAMLPVSAFAAETKTVINSVTITNKVTTMNVGDTHTLQVVVDGTVTEIIPDPPVVEPENPGETEQPGQPDTGETEQPGQPDTGETEQPGQPDTGETEQPGQPDTGETEQPGQPDTGETEQPGQPDTGETVKPGETENLPAVEPENPTDTEPEQSGTEENTDEKIEDETGAVETQAALLAALADAQVTWSTSDATVATVNNGTVTAVNAGTVTITATSVDDATKSDSCTITVSEVAVTGIKLTSEDERFANGKATIENGEKLVLVADISPENATDKTVTWTSSDTSIATVNNGTVTARKVGSATITVASKENPELQATCELTVNEATVKSVTISSRYVTITDNTCKIPKGNTVTFTATVAPSQVADKSVKWETSNEDVVSIDKNGRATARKAGTAVITATSVANKEIKDSVEITIDIVNVSRVSITPSNASVEVNAQYQLQLNVTPSNADDQSATWTSSDPSIARVDNAGCVTGVKEGTVTITAKSHDGDFTATSTVRVTAHTHNWVDDTVVKAPACTEAGTVIQKCSGCSTTREVVAEATGHTPEIDPAVDAICVADGLTEGSHCSVCGEVLTAQEEIPATGIHKFTEWEVVEEPGEYVKGSQMRKCTLCGVKEYETIPATGHIKHRFPETGEVVVAPTCTEEGEMLYTCLGCEETKTEVIPALGHTPEVDAAVEPTCTETGLTEGSHCSVCGEVFVEQDVIEALGHDYVVVDENKAECSRCDNVLYQNGLSSIDGQLLLYKDGENDTTYTGFYAADGHEYYVESGRVTGKSNGLYKDTKNVIGTKTGSQNYYVVNSEISRVNSVVKNTADGRWWKVTNGEVDTKFTGFASNSNGDWYAVNGEVKPAATMTNVIKDTRGDLGKAGTWYYVVNNKVTYTNTVAKNANGWWYIVKGKVDFSYTGVAKNANGWWRIENGKVNFNFNGIAYNSNGGWLLQNGKVNFNYTGRYKWNGKTYKIVNGKVS